MKCKYCQAELESNSSVCPACGKDNLKDNLKGLKIVTLVLVCLVMLVLLAGLVCYGVTGSFVPNFGGDSTEPTGDSTEATLSEEDKAFLAAMDDVIVTMGDYEMTNGDLQLYYWLVAYNTEGVDLTKSLDEQIYDEESGKTYSEYCQEEAIKAWQEIMLMYHVAKEAGYEMSEEYTEYLSSMKDELEYYVQMYAYYGYDISSVDELIQMQFGPGCDYDVYYNYTYNYYYGNLYWAEMLEDIDVTEEDINNYFTENEESLKNDYELSITKDFGNLIDIRNIRIDVEEDTEEAWANCLTSAQEILDKWNSGDKTEESFGKLAAEYSVDEVTKDLDGLSTDLYRSAMAEVDVRHILVIPEGGTLNDDGYTYTYTDEEWSAALTEAQGLLDQWLAGDKTEESFGEMANEHSDDNNGAVTNGGIYTDVMMGQMVEEFEDWCFDTSRQTGDYGIVKTVFGYHIMYFVRADLEVDNWICDENRTIGEVEMVKTDNGYQILYFVGAEPAWYRYSRYGAQVEKADDILDGLVEEHSYTVDEEKIVIGEIA